jgi:N-acetyl-gamma-glutamyl-phosphate reductase
MPHNTSNPQQKLKASIIGVSGYTGLELLRLLLAHPHVEIAYLTSRQHDNVPLGEMFPHLKGYEAESYTITNTAPETVARASDVVFLALPHKTAQDVVAEIYGLTKIIDLSADYRLDDTATYEKYYGLAHHHPELLHKSIYGAPEFHRAEIAKADIIANPGCFALLAQLMLYPFQNIIKHADIFAITGSSGAGKSASDGTHHPVRNHNIKSYNINIHRHIPEITRTTGIKPEQMNFIPSSGPFTRGIFMQGFITLQDGVTPQCAATLYENEPFVRVVETVALANIVGANYCDLSFQQGHDRRIIAQGALDNLVKGAAGCAIQNMNIVFGLDETAGLKILAPLYP